MSSVKVAVRVRPFNTREISNNAKIIIAMAGNTTSSFCEHFYFHSFHKKKRWKNWEKEMKENKH